jgi:prepilin-type N-terminal cleavage/methylation domain-containing protein
MESMKRLLTNSMSRRVQRSRSATGFTLVELLVVITIMGILAGVLALALASAISDAKANRTKTELATVGTVLQGRMSEISLAPINFVNAPAGNVGVPFGAGVPALSTTALAGWDAFAAQERARAIMLARRDIARMALPECQADLLYPPATIQFRSWNTAVQKLKAPDGSNAPVSFVTNAVQVKPPSQWNQMRSLVGLLSAEELDSQYGGGSPATRPEYDAIAIATNDATFNTLLRTRIDGTLMTWTREHESAECLYLILATTNLHNGKAIDNIPADRIRDTDGDGVPEVLDPWEKPYAFIREPIGLRSPAIKNFRPSGANVAERFPVDPDPMDFLVSDVRYEASVASSEWPIYLPPVIISSGRDKAFGLRLTYLDDDEDGTPESGVSAQYSSSVVHFEAGTAGPIYPLFTGGGTSLWRYPDPYYNISLTNLAYNGAFDFSAAMIAQSKQGAGLGGILDSETASDNITSLDAGF